MVQMPVARRVSNHSVGNLAGDLRRSTTVCPPSVMGGHTTLYTGMFPSGKTAEELAAAINQEHAVGWVDPIRIDQFLTDHIVIMAGVDGSDASMLGLQYVVRGFMMQDRATELHIVHVSDPDKQNLPAKYKPENIRSQCEALVMSNLVRRRYDFHWVSKDGMTAGQRIVQEIAITNVDFITMGYWGRKGRGQLVDTFKTTLMEVVRHGRCSVIVVNPSGASNLPIGRPTKFVVSANLNAAAVKAFVDAIRLSKPGDEIHVVYVKSYLESEESDYTIQVREKYEALFNGLDGTAEDGCQELQRFRDRLASFTVVDKHMRESTAEAVVRYAEDEDADFIVVGASIARVDRGKDPIGSVSMEICLETSTSFIVSAYAPDFRPGAGSPLPSRPGTAPEGPEAKAEAYRAVDRLARASVQAHH